MIYVSRPGVQFNKPTKFISNFLDSKLAAHEEPELNIDNSILQHDCLYISVSGRDVENTLLLVDAIVEQEEDEAEKIFLVCRLSGAIFEDAKYREYMTLKMQSNHSASVAAESERLPIEQLLNAGPGDSNNWLDFVQTRLTPSG